MVVFNKRLVIGSISNHIVSFSWKVKSVVIMLDNYSRMG